MLHNILPFKEFFVGFVYMYAMKFGLHTFTCFQGLFSLFSYPSQLFFSYHHFFLLNEFNTLKLNHDILALFVLKLGFLNFLNLADVHVGSMRMKVFLVEIYINLFKGLCDFLPLWCLRFFYIYCEI